MKKIVGIPTRSWYQRGYGEIGRRYGLNWIEPWYGNLLSDNFQIQRNPGIKNGQSRAKSLFCFEKTRVYKTRIKKDRCRDSMEAVLTNGVDYVLLVAGIRLSKLQKRWSYIPNTYVYILPYQTINHDPILLS